jgi:hypothetical protein
MEITKKVIADLLDFGGCHYEDTSLGKHEASNSPLLHAPLMNLAKFFDVLDKAKPVDTQPSRSYYSTNGISHVRHYHHAGRTRH